MKLKRKEWFIITSLFLFSFIPTFGGLVRILDLTTKSNFIPINSRALAAPIPIIIHIITSFIFCIFGIIQFIHTIRKKYPSLHKKVGIIVILSGLVSATTAMWMTHNYTFPHGLQGSLLYWSRFFFSLAMIALIVFSVMNLINGRFKKHGNNLLRAYSIGQGASTQTVLGISWMLIYKAQAQGTQRDFLMLFAWVINFLIIETYIFKTQRR
jgi:hypothetical protein